MSSNRERALSRPQEPDARSALDPESSCDPSRRDFLQQAAGGLVIAGGMTGLASSHMAEPQPARSAETAGCR